MHTVPTGWVQEATTWLPPRTYPPPIEIEVNDSKWMRHDSTGNELGYQGGIGGACFHLDPPFGYWCSQHPNRTSSGALTHRSPSGLVYESHLPHAPYAHPQGAVVHSCRGGANCWFTWMFEVDNMSDGKVTWSKGGFQGAEGSDAGGIWYIEGVREELDWPREFVYDEASSTLYYFQNASESDSPPPSGFTVPSVKVCVRVATYASHFVLLFAACMCVVFALSVFSHALVWLCVFVSPSDSSTLLLTQSLLIFFLSRVR